MALWAPPVTEHTRKGAQPYLGWMASSEESVHTEGHASRKLNHKQTSTNTTACAPLIKSLHALLKSRKGHTPQGI